MTTSSIYLLMSNEYYVARPCQMFISECEKMADKAMQFWQCAMI